jgi:hypothetical protein
MFSAAHALREHLPDGSHLAEDSERAVGLPLSVGDPQAFHAEQRRCRILGHSARGFLMIMMSLARSMILGAAGVLITPPRPTSAPYQPVRPAALTQRHQAATRSRLTSKSHFGATSATEKTR